MKYLKLTEKEADQVRGIYKESHELNPVSFYDYWILPVAVLDKKEFNDVSEVLKSLPKIDINESEFTEL